MDQETIILVTDKGRITLSAEWARTPAEKLRGLMFRRSLGDDKGMLFTYEDPQEIHMWMRNTYISLDMIFITSDGYIHRIAQNTEPLSETIVPSRGNVVAVLEMKGGSAERLGLKPGDEVLHPFFKGAAAK